jgi:outer membrane lipoprotein-sorting protein
MNIRAARPKIVVASLVLVVSVQFHGITSSQDAEPRPDLDSVLAKWEQASQAIRTFDAQFTRITYDPVFDREQRSQGRFYFEAPDRGYFGDDTSIAFVWTDVGSFVVDHRNKTSMLCPRETIHLVRRQIGQMPTDTFWQRLRKQCTLAVAATFCPEELLPAFLNLSTQAECQRFDFTVEQRDGKLLLKAVPKKQQDRGFYREINVMLDADSYLLLAYRTIDPSGDRTVYLFSDTKINKRPSDRDTLLTAVLPGYRLLRADETVFGVNGSEQQYKR